MNYQQNLQGCFKAMPSNFKNFNIYLEKSKKAVEKILMTKNELQILELVHQNDDLILIKKIADSLKRNFDNIVILGTGGSSLGGQTLCALRKPNYCLPQSKPNIYFIDNIDPDTFETLFTILPPKKTGFVIISKSGTTPETLFQFLTILTKWQETIKGDKLKKHFVIITEDQDNPLRNITKQHNFNYIPHPQNIGGRFSAFSCVGLLPAMIAGMDIEAIRKGAQQVLKETFNIFASKPSIGASIATSLYEQNNININVIMPYVDKLKPFSLWYRQLIAESLGKENKGITPIASMGTIDQHSQLQLYLDGPKNKYFTIIINEETSLRGEQVTSSNIELDYLNKVKMGELLTAECKATVNTLISKGCPVRTISIPKLNEYTIGSLMMHFFLEVIIIADLMKINPFNQPAVEQGKILTKQYLKEFTSQ